MRRCGATLAVLRAIVVMGGACAVGAGCGRSSRAAGPGGVVVPSRATTIGDRGLRYLPAGADLFVEIDLGRLRGNAVVGAVVTGWMRSLVADPATVPDVAAGGEAGPAAGGAPAIGSGSGSGSGSTTAARALDAVHGLTRAPLLSADAIVLAAYGVGTDEAATATLILGGEHLAGAVELAPRVAVLAPPALVRRAEATTAGAEPSLASDRELLALRASAMPARARGASLRVAARLDFDARVALAALTGAETAPRALSLWIDVVDDAALVAEIDGGGDASSGKGRAPAPGATDDAARLETVLATLRDRMIANGSVRAAGLAPALRRTRIERRGEHLRVVAVVGPRRLRKAAELAEAEPAAVAPSEKAAPPAAKAAP